MKSNLRLRVLVPTAVLALLGIAVGAFAFSGSPGGDGPAAPIQPPAAATPPAVEPGEGVTLAAWAKEANAICAEVDEKNSKLGTAQSAADLLNLLPVSLGYADETVAGLRALEVPAENAKQIEKMIGHYARFVEIERTALVPLQAGDMQGYLTLTGEAYAAGDKGDAIALELGAKACAEDGRADTELARELERHRVVVVALYAPGAMLDGLAIREARAGAVLAGAGFAAIDVYDPQEISPLAAEYPSRGTPATLVYVRGRGPVTQFTGYVDRVTIAQAVDDASL
jgi:hypothetical protein